MKIFLPRQTYRGYTDLSPQEVKDAINGMIDHEYLNSPLTLMKGSYSHFYYGVVTEEKILLYNIPMYLGFKSLKIVGEIIPNGNGSNITLKFKNLAILPGIGFLFLAILFGALIAYFDNEFRMVIYILFPVMFISFVIIPFAINAWEAKGQFKIHLGMDLK